jgi:hypothetical protein
LQDDKISTEDEYEEKFNATKIAMGANFDSLTSFPKVEIRKWLNFVIDNVEHKSIAREQHVNLSSIKSEMLSIRVYYNKI